MLTKAFEVKTPTLLRIEQRVAKLKKKENKFLNINKFYCYFHALSLQVLITLRSTWFSMGFSYYGVFGQSDQIEHFRSTSEDLSICFAQLIFNNALLHF